MEFRTFSIPSLICTARDAKGPRKGGLPYSNPPSSSHANPVTPNTHSPQHRPSPIGGQAPPFQSRMTPSPGSQRGTNPAPTPVLSLTCAPPESVLSCPPMPAPAPLSSAMPLPQLLAANAASMRHEAAAARAERDLLAAAFLTLFAMFYELLLAIYEKQHTAVAETPAPAGDRVTRTPSQTAPTITRPRAPHAAQAAAATDDPHPAPVACEPAARSRQPGSHRPDATVLAFPGDGARTA